MRIQQLFGLGALLLLACTPAAAPTPAAPAPPAATAVREVRADKQVLRVATNAFPSNPTPQGGSFFPHFYMPLYDSLTWFGPGFSVVPALAQTWNVSPDGLVWTFKLRNDVKWPDGTTLTADDVVFTVETIIANNWPQRPLIASVKETKAIDATTVQFTTTTRDMAMPNSATFLRIVPKAYYSQVGFDGFVQKPVGSGPYELAEYKPGDVTRFKKKATKHAFRDTPIEELIFRQIPDISQQVNGLRVGELDMAIGSFSPEQLEALKRADIQVLVQETTSSHINIPYTTYEAKNSPLKDKRVREALNYAIDKEAIAKGVYKGFNRPVGQMGTPGSPWWDDSVQPWPFDPKKAKDLLAAAGYPNGFKIAYDQQPGQVPVDLVLAVQSNLRDVGIEMEINQLDQATFLDRYFGRQPKSDLFPLVSGETSGFFTSFRNAYTCSPGGAPGLGLYCNAEVDKLIADAYQEPDATKRAQVFKQANRVMRADVPQIWLLTVNQGVVHGPKLKGVNIVTPTQFNMDSVYIIQ